MILLGKRISVLIVLLFVLILGVIIVSTPRTENIYKNSMELYPNIISELDRVSVININNKDKSLLFKKNNDGGWEISNNNNFPAQMNLVNDLLLGIAYLKKIEQKTKDPKLYSLLHVDDVKDEKSLAIAMTLKDSTNKVLVNLLVGKRGRQSVIGNKQQQLYVRKKGERQSWLVEGYLPISLEFKDWVYQPLLPVLANEIHKITIYNNHTRKIPIILLKEKEDGNFYIKDESKKTTLIQPNNSLINLLSNLEYNHAISYKEMVGHWRPNLTIEIETIHNFKLHIEIAKIKQAVYARVFASVVDNKHNNNVQQTDKFNTINEFSKSWLFQISGDIYSLANKPQKELVEFLKV